MKRWPTTQRIFSLLCLCVVLMKSPFALATKNLVLREVPEFFTLESADNLTELATGPSCNVLPAGSQGVPCNPALLPFFTGQKFSASLFLGDDYAQVNRYRRLLETDQELNFAKDLFDQKRPVEMTAGTSLSFRHKNFGVQLVPYRITYFSVVRNKFYPKLAIHAQQERSLALQYGKRVYPSLILGVEARLTERKFVHEEFDFFEAVGDLEETIPIKRQKAIYLEPAAVWEWQGVWGKPRLTGKISNVGYVDRKFEESAMNPIMDLGVGFTPPMRWGRLELGINYRAHEDLANDWSRFRLGTSYQLGLMSAIAGLSRDSLAAGVASSFYNIRVGVVYRRRKVEKVKGFEVTEDAVFSEFSVSL